MVYQVRFSEILRSFIYYDFHCTENLLFFFCWFRDAVFLLRSMDAIIQQAHDIVCFTKRGTLLLNIPSSSFFSICFSCFIAFHSVGFFWLSFSTIIYCLWLRIAFVLTVPHYLILRAYRGHEARWEQTEIGQYEMRMYNIGCDMN